MTHLVTKVIWWSPVDPSPGRHTSFVPDGEPLAEWIGAMWDIDPAMIVIESTEPNVRADRA